MSENSLPAWRCTVCQYIHRGDNPPEHCPVCGCPAPHFEKHADAGNNHPAPEADTWACLVCDHRHSGKTPPEKCAVCGVPADKFEPVYEPEDSSETSDAEKEKIVIIGGGIAGISAAESVRKRSASAEITLISKETQSPYYRLNLTRFLAGEVKKENLLIHNDAWYSENDITLVTNTEASSISLSDKTVSAADGKSHRYDKLILTAGSHALMPPVPGTERNGVVKLRSLNDAERILDTMDAASAVVIIGGGVLGLETAAALANHSKEITVIESYSRLMPKDLDETAAGLLQARMEEMGIRIRTGVAVRDIRGDRHVKEVRLEDGSAIPADLVIFTAGIRANSYLARMAGLHVNNGVIVNDFMQTSDPSVYAAGDIAEHNGEMYGLWNAAQRQGRIAGMNALGEREKFEGFSRSNSIKIVGVKLLSIGRFEGKDGSDIIKEAEKDGGYSRFVFRDTHLVGAILYGNTKISGRVKKAIENREDFSGLLNSNPSAEDIWKHLGG